MFFSFVSDNTFCNYGLFIWMMKRFKIVGRTQKETRGDRLGFLFCLAWIYCKIPREAVGADVNLF